MADVKSQHLVRETETNPNGTSTATPSKDTPLGFSAGVLRDRLSTLAATPVQALQANVSFVPATVPKKRRLQTLAVTVYSLLVPICCSLYLFLWSIPAMWPFLMGYTAWMLWVDKAQEHGGRFSPWIRGIRFFKYFVEYYPASFLKTCDLPADRTYVFGYHPHGIIGTGAIATFATSASGFPSAFPGITPHLLTLASNFRLPFYRDLLLAQGICSVSKKACNAILKEGGPGAAIVIVVGGAAESLSAHPGTADLTLRKRLGFIKVAIQHGASLVPVFAFGENDIYQQMPNEKGTLVYSFQKRFQSLFGFTLPLFHGRGILNYNLGLLPYRRRIVSVIGRPITCTQSDRPTSEEVTAVQQQYIAELMHIWNTYKDEFARSRKRELSIIE